MSGSKSSASAQNRSCCVISGVSGNTRLPCPPHVRAWAARAASNSARCDSGFNRGTKTATRAGRTPRLAMNRDDLPSGSIIAGAYPAPIRGLGIEPCTPSTDFCVKARSCEAVSSRERCPSGCMSQTDSTEASDSYTLVLDGHRRPPDSCLARLQERNHVTARSWTGRQGAGGADDRIWLAYICDCESAAASPLNGRLFGLRKQRTPPYSIPCPRSRS